MSPINRCEECIERLQRYCRVCVGLIAMYQIDKLTNWQIDKLEQISTVNSAISLQIQNVSAINSNIPPQKQLWLKKYKYWLAQNNFTVTYSDDVILLLLLLLFYFATSAYNNKCKHDMQKEWNSDSQYGSYMTYQTNLSLNKSDYKEKVIVC